MNDKEKWYYVLDSNILLHELKLVRRLIKKLRKKRNGKIVIPYAVKQELEGMLNGLEKDDHPDKKLYARAKKAMSLIEESVQKQKQGNSVVLFERTRGNGIVPKLLREETRAEATDPKRPSINDFRILAVATWLRQKLNHSGSNSIVCLVTADKALREATKKESLKIILKKKYVLKGIPKKQGIPLEKIQYYGIVVKKSLKEETWLCRAVKKIKRFFI